MTILVTGGAGFIGANFVQSWVRDVDEAVVNLDKLTYAGNLESLASIAGEPAHTFVRGDICDDSLLGSLLAEYRPRAIVHFAAESHVDRSIRGPEDFVQTNVVGTFRLLDAARAYWLSLSDGEQERFRVINVSTDEVYGSLGPGDRAFSEDSPYAPNSPYSASKAAADHLARSYFQTYGLPVITTNCSNNYGPYQFPEKLIPLTILNGIKGDPLPVYGDGGNVRDWLYVDDHCRAIRMLLTAGRPGASYTIGGNSELANIDVVRQICALLDDLLPTEQGSRSELIEFVTDRPGHDRRYAIDSSRLADDTGWAPAESFASGLEKTVRWYLDNGAWVDDVISGEYRKWIDLHYGNR